MNIITIYKNKKFLILNFFPHLFFTLPVSIKVNVTKRSHDQMENSGSNDKYKDLRNETKIKPSKFCKKDANFNLDVSNEDTEKEFYDNYDHKISLHSNIKNLPFKKREQMYLILNEQLKGHPAFATTNLTELNGYSNRRKYKYKF